jgi:hypothetical protein
MSERLSQHRPEVCGSSSSAPQRSDVPDRLGASVKLNAAKIGALMAMLAQVRQGIVGQSGVPDALLEQEFGENRIDDMPALWRQMQPERLAIGVVMLEDAWRTVRAEASGSETGLFDVYYNQQPRPITAQSLENSGYPLVPIINGLHSTCQWGLEEWEEKRAERLSQGCRDPLDVVFRRMRLIAGHSSEGGGRWPCAGFFMSGVRTQIQEIHAVAQVIPLLHERDMRRKIDPQTYRTILRGTFGQYFSRPSRAERSQVFGQSTLTGGRLTRMHHTVPCPTHYQTMLNPDLFYLQGTSIRPREAAGTSAGLAAETSEMPLVCPAPFAEGTVPGTYVLKELFDWSEGLISAHHAPIFDEA